MKNYLRKTSKGQSAIEYLMTYGWMLLVVAIVGGAIFATVQNQRQQCSGEVPAVLEAGQNDGFGVTSFGVGSPGAQVELTNNGQEQVTVTSISFGTDSTPNPSTNVDINVGSSETFTFDDYSPADSCTEANLEITFNQGSISGQQLSGNITASMQ